MFKIKVGDFMNVIKKIVMILIIGIMISSCMPKNISLASGGFISIEEDINFKSKLPKEKDVKNLKEIIEKFLKAIRTIAVLVLVIVVSTTGIRYLTATNADIKEEIKITMFPIIMGLILLFGAVTIAGFIISAFGK